MGVAGGHELGGCEKPVFLQGARAGPRQRVSVAAEEQAGWILRGDPHLASPGALSDSALQSNRQVMSSPQSSDSAPQPGLGRSLLS